MKEKQKQGNQRKIKRINRKIKRRKRERQRSKHMRKQTQSLIIDATVILKLCAHFVDQ
jgi:hypothetical protein